MSSPLLRLGVIGLSEGNGHPYSWAAIINGYDRAAMDECPFPAIPAYLRARQFPADQLQGAQVTHVWTQDLAVSAHIARAARIPNVVKNSADMLGAVDAVLLARDDAERHRELAAPFFEAGLPVYIDKPVALSVRELNELFALSGDPTRLFSCSALRFAQELLPTSQDLQQLQVIENVSGVTPKSWDRYAVHLIDPVVSFLRPGALVSKRAVAQDGRRMLHVTWASGCAGSFEATGASTGEIALTYVSRHASIKKTFTDSFTAFRRALDAFLDGVRHGYSASPYEHLRSVVELIESGRGA